MMHAFSKYLSVRSGWLVGLTFVAFTASQIIMMLVLIYEKSLHPIIFLGFAVIIIAAYAIYRLIYFPFVVSSRILKLFNTGYTVHDLFEQNVAFSPEMEAVINQLQKLLDKDELISATKKQAQYLALQNQINPHFLYNTLEGIRGESLHAGLNNIADMAEGLATFYRYTISNIETLVKLEDELANVHNYYLIQKYRFGDRINMNVTMDDEKAGSLYYMPKLVLQPIIENAIFHGIERRIGQGVIDIRIEETNTRLIITISDNGVGIDEDQLNQLREKLNHTMFNYVKPSGERRGGIAIINVNNRIKLLFGENYGVSIYSKKQIGTDVELTLPLLTREMTIRYEN